MVQLVRAADVVRALGSRDVGATHATAYEVDVVVAELPAAFPNRAQLRSAGVTRLI